MTPVYCKAYRWESIWNDIKIIFTIFLFLFVYFLGLSCGWNLHEQYIKENPEKIVDSSK